MKENGETLKVAKGTELSRGMVVEGERMGDGVNSTLYRRVPRTFLFTPGCNPLDELKSTLRLPSLSETFFSPFYLGRFRSA